MSIIRVTKRHFDAHFYTKNASLRGLAREVSWFKGIKGKILGAVFQDQVDRDYGYVVLGRDALKRFRTIEMGAEFFSTPEQAEQTIVSAMKEFEKDGKTIYHQGDEVDKPLELLIPVVKSEQQHPYFKILVSEKRFEAASHLIRELAYGFTDVDGNYIKDFQSTWFDARLWELFLYAYFQSSGFHLHNQYAFPDFVIDRFGDALCVEAVTVNSNPDFDEDHPQTQKEILRLLRDYMPIKFGSPLYSKLKKAYWKHSHVKGKPLVFAIHDYHIQASIEGLGSMTWSRSAISDYLYGHRVDYELDGNDKLAVNKADDGRPMVHKIESHSWKHKTIPSGFFFQDECENVSAVLFANSATLTTFNRRGKLAGLGSDNVRMIRYCAITNPEPSSIYPFLKVFDVDDPDYEEGWGDGLIMYHNPVAKYPLNPSLFPEITHMFFEPSTMEFRMFLGECDILNSYTIVVAPKP
ncbi:hypothetical protein ACFLR1_03855 [Bacteroidota bacterium]